MPPKIDWRKFFSIAGLIYMIVYGLVSIFAVVFLVLYFKHGPWRVDAAGILLVPLLGLYAGYCIRYCRFRIWQVILIVLSLVATTILLLFLLVLPRTLGQIKAQNAAAAVLSVKDQQLLDAAFENKKSLVEGLLKSGANVNVKNGFGQTPLHVAQDPGVIKLLLAGGADPNTKDFDFQMTPIFNKDAACMLILAQAGADINVRSKDANTPLIWHSYSGHLAGVRLLVSLGADVNAVNKDGHTALDIAENFGHENLADYLKSVGGKSARKKK